MSLADWVDPAVLDAELDVVRAEFAAADALIAGGGGHVERVVCTIVAGQDINQPGVVAFTETAQSGSGFTVAAAAVTVNFTGWVAVSFGLNLSGSAVRGAPQVTGQINGSPMLGLVAGHTYIRQTGHTTTSANAMVAAYPVTVNDVLTLVTSAPAGNGSVTVAAGSGLSLNRIG